MYKMDKGKYKKIKGKKLEKYICKDCHQTFFNYDYNLCPYCDSMNSGDISNTVYIFADCFSYANGKPDQFSGYTTIVTNDRFDLEDKYNIEYINRKGFNGTTNNYGEMMGIIDGLVYFINEYDDLYETVDKLIVISDSEYAILGARDRMDRWKAKGWKNTTGEVKNKELWIKMYELVNIIKNDIGINLEFRHQKGHAGKDISKNDNPIIYIQEKCDSMSTELKEKILRKKGLK